MFRDKPSDLLLVIGMALMMFLVVYGNGLFSDSAELYSAQPEETVLSENVVREQLEMQTVFEKYEILFYDFSFICCAINFFVILYIWIRRRSRELAIRRIYGYGLRKLLGRTLRELLSLWAVSASLFIVLWMVSIIMDGQGGRRFSTGAAGNLFILSIALAVVFLMSISAELLWLHPVSLLKNEK